MSRERDRRLSRPAGMSRPAEGTRASKAVHVLFGLIAAALLALGVRLFLFQRQAQASMSALAQQQYQRTIELDAPRGSIYARGHASRVTLAASRQVPSCFADPMILPPERLPELSARLGEILGRPGTEVLAKLTERPQARFLWLAREIDDAAARQIEDMRVPGIKLKYEWRRHYPNGSLAAHVVGFSGGAGAGLQGVGLEGVELWADEHLRPAKGQRVVLVDAGQRAYRSEVEEYRPPRAGCDVELTIDVVIQGFLEKALTKAAEQYRAESAVGIVLEPRTGEVLALANVPTYDLNAFGQADPDWRANRAITHPYEPGSIFKPYTASAALQRGATRMGESIFCHNGAYHCRSGRTLHDAHGYGALTFEMVVIKSSNIGMAILGERLGNPTLYEIITGFGFGRTTGIELKGEDPGLVNPLPRWTSYTTTSVPMGQEVGITAIQMATAFAAFGNEGVLLKPRIVRSITDPEGQVVWDNSSVRAVGEVVKPSVNRLFVEQVLAKVPVEGTGKAGRLDGWTSFGKTGTAQIARIGGRGYEPDAYTGSYIAGSPVVNPRLVCLVSVRRFDRSVGRYGGGVAGPVVKEILEQSLAYLEVPKDDPTGSRQGPRSFSEEDLRE